MAGPGKRIDLRFGSFACSVQGFDDPTVPLKVVLRQIGETLSGKPGIGAIPLFDRQTLQRLEDEISAGTGGRVQAVPGLVLTRFDGGADDASARKEEDERSPLEEGATAAGTIFAPRHEERSDEPTHSDADDTAARPVNLFAEVEVPLTAEPDDTPPAAIATDAGPKADAPQIEDTEGASGTNLFVSDNADDAAAELADEPNVFSDDQKEHGRGAPAGDAGSPFHDLDRYRRDTAPSDMERAGPADRPDDPPGMSIAQMVQAAEARTVPDLLAATAAWLTLVRGHHSFTRPEVIEVFDRLDGDHPRTLEAKIKGFGKLVRDGQLRPLDHERFELSDDERRRWEALV